MLVRKSAMDLSWFAGRCLNAAAAALVFVVADMLAEQRVRVELISEKVMHNVTEEGWLRRSSGANKFT